MSTTDTNAPAGTVEASTDQIKAAINAALTKFAGGAMNVSDARDALKDASDAEIGERERLITNVAALAHAGNWSYDDTVDIIKSAVNDRNAKGSSLATFASELRRACHKNTRNRVGSMFKLAHAAWDAETAVIEAAEKKDDAPKPLRRAFSRCYHLVVQGMMGAAIADARFFDSAEGLVNFAEAKLRAAEVNYQRVFKRLQRIHAELQGFHKDFPVDGIGDCLEFLTTVTEADLKACRSRSEAAPTPEAEPEANDDDSAGDIAPGISDLSDLLDGALGDQAA